MIGIAYSVRDIASKGIFESLRSLLNIECFDVGGGMEPAVGVCEGGSIRIVGFDEDVIYFEFLDRFFDYRSFDAVIVLSRHRASSGVPSLTVHSTGNPGPQALYGGRPFEIAYSRPSYAGSLLYYVWRASLGGEVSIGFEVTYEATHHGPTSNRVPVVFVELGSSEREWGLSVGHGVWARAIDMFIDKGSICRELAVGFGGSHYPERFTRMTIEKGVCFGHIIPGMF
jgi:D-aminoacyl-tRNA deacylase